ncbi:hypothetical protein F7725_001676 [Dissostichus mawsoni]|uniref:Uncharacterized protein n=1 Tax=Dissostichus mawsoni TaxID=36200 RepID=A0A7J5Y2C7_DISMA|nr:hypothetical protein F7725_001676 [Dissostichus mawsoni]
MYKVADLSAVKFNSLRILLQSPLTVLQEAHGPDVHAELLIRATNVHGGKVHYRKSGRFLCPVIGALQDHGLLQVAILLVLVAHRVLAVVGDALRGLFGKQADEGHLNELTCVPRFMSAPNHTGLFLEVLHHCFRGMLSGLAAMHVSPVSMLQCTLMASSTLPWFGSTQYSPAQQHHQHMHFSVITGAGRVLLAAVGALHAADLAAEGLQGGLHAGVHRQDGGAVAVGHGLVLAELWRAGVVVVKAAEEVISGSSGGSWGPGGPAGPDSPGGPCGLMESKYLGSNFSTQSSSSRRAHGSGLSDVAFLSVGPDGSWRSLNHNHKAHLQPLLSCRHHPETHRAWGAGESLRTNQTLWTRVSSVSLVPFVSGAAGGSGWSSLSLSAVGSMVSTETGRTLFTRSSQGSGLSQAELTVGPGGPTRPADPGKPVGPWKQERHTLLRYCFTSLITEGESNTLPVLRKSSALHVISPSHKMRTVSTDKPWGPGDPASPFWPGSPGSPFTPGWPPQLSSLSGYTSLSLRKKKHHPQSQGSYFTDRLNHLVLWSSPTLGPICPTAARCSPEVLGGHGVQHGLLDLVDPDYPVNRKLYREALEYLGILWIPET